MIHGDDCAAVTVLWDDDGWVHASTRPTRDDILRALIVGLREGKAGQRTGSVIGALRREFPDIDWIGRLGPLASTYRPFLDSHLDIDWWVGEVERWSLVEGQVASD